MIKYDQRRCSGLSLIFQCDGSVFRRVFIPAALSCVFTLTLKVLRAEGFGLESVMSHPFPYQFFSFLLGFMLVFRTQLSYERFWEGRTMLELMCSKWSDVALQVVVFDSVKGEQHELTKWKRQILSAISLLHAVALGSLGGITNLDVLAGLDPAQIDAGLNHPRLPKDGELKVALVLQWVQQLVTERMQLGLAVPPPILSRVFQELSTGHLGYRNALKIKKTPFPFPYAQFISLAIWILVPSSGILMDFFVSSRFWAVVFSFMAVGGYCGVNEVSMELEDPFGRDENDLQMEEFHREFIEKLLMLHHNYLPEYKTPSFDSRLSIIGQSCSIGGPEELLSGTPILADRLAGQVSVLRWSASPAFPVVDAIGEEMKRDEYDRVSKLH